MRIFLLLILITVSFQQSVFALEDQIVAIVGKEPITSSELEQRKKLMRFFNNIPSLSSEEEKIFTQTILQTLIDDKVLLQYSIKSRVKVSDLEINNLIKNIEANAKMPDGNLKKIILNAHITSDAFNDKMRSDVLRSKIIQMLSGQISVSKKEVDSLILDTNSRDATLSFKVFTARSKHDRIYKSMSKLSSKAKNCNNTASLRYHSFATMKELETTLSALPANVQGLVKDLQVGHATGVIKDEKLQVYLLCAKNIHSFSDQDADQLSQLVGNKQLNNKARKFLQNLRKKTYVKILI